MSKWHFIDYPTDQDSEAQEQFLVKTTDGELLVAEWDSKEGAWLDVGRDRSWFTGGVSCWAYLYDFDIPETTKQMPRYRA